MGCSITIYVFENICTHGPGTHVQGAGRTAGQRRGCWRRVWAQRSINTKAIRQRRLQVVYPGLWPKDPSHPRRTTHTGTEMPSARCRPGGAAVVLPLERVCVCVCHSGTGLMTLMSLTISIPDGPRTPRVIPAEPVHQIPSCTGRAAPFLTAPSQEQLTAQH